MCQIVVSPWWGLVENLLACLHSRPDQVREESVAGVRSEHLVRANELRESRLFAVDASLDLRCPELHPVTDARGEIVEVELPKLLDADSDVFIREPRRR